MTVDHEPALGSLGASPARYEVDGKAPRSAYGPPQASSCPEKDFGFSKVDAPPALETCCRALHGDGGISAAHSRETGKLTCERHNVVGAIDATPLRVIEHDAFSTDEATSR